MIDINPTYWFYLSSNYKNDCRPYSCHCNIKRSCFVLHPIWNRSAFWSWLESAKRPGSLLVKVWRRQWDLEKELQTKGQVWEFWLPAGLPVTTAALPVRSRSMCWENATLFSLSERPFVYDLHTKVYLSPADWNKKLLSHNLSRAGIHLCALQFPSAFGKHHLSRISNAAGRYSILRRKRTRR